MEDVRRFRALLEKKREELSDRAKTIRRYGLDEAQADSVGELSAYDNHPADLGDETFERGKDLGLLDNARVLLGKVEEALARIKSGTYGRCELCGRDIDLDRLEAVPWTTLCRE